MGKNIRLHKYLADCGVASRRKAEELIAQGKVAVNGEVVTKLGTTVDPESDIAEIGGSVVRWLGDKVYIKLNKPRGYVSSCRSQRGEKTILDLVKELPVRLFPVGRLDKDSEGLMLLTNDGELANSLMHPKYEHEKEYEVNVQFPMSNVQLRNLSSGIFLAGKIKLPARVQRVDEKNFRIILKEGKKRQIRKMVEAVGGRVVRLKRIRIGHIHLGSLAPGKFAYLSPDEVML